MKLAIHQPQFLPYPGYFHKLTLVDTLVVLDEAQYDKRFTNRNRILGPHGPIWLTVPIDKSQKFARNMDVRIRKEIPWQGEHWKKILHSYGSAPWFGTYGPYFEEVYAQSHERLVDLDLATTSTLLEWLGIHLKVVMESELGVGGKGTERLVSLCQAMGADVYVSGPGGRGYMDERLFQESNIELRYQKYFAEPYSQRFGKTFVPDLSVIDLLFNLGPGGRELVSSPRSSGLHEESLRVAAVLQ